MGYLGYSKIFHHPKLLEDVIFKSKWRLTMECESHRQLENIEQKEKNSHFHTIVEM